jgi:hypothetical protein
MATTEPVLFVFVVASAFVPVNGRKNNTERRRGAEGIPSSDRLSALLYPLRRPKAGGIGSLCVSL